MKKKALIIQKLIFIHKSVKVNFYYSFIMFCITLIDVGAFRGLNHKSVHNKKFLSQKTQIHPQGFFFIFYLFFVTNTIFFLTRAHLNLDIKETNYKATELIIYTTLLFRAEPITERVKSTIQ